jgi:hypothetical protein
MTTLREAAQQALEALKDCVKALDALHAPGDSIYTRASDSADRAEIALRDALGVGVGEHGGSMFRFFVQCRISTKKRNSLMQQAATELRRLHADAERYRYLRNRNPQEILPVSGNAAGVWIDCDDENGELTLLTGEDADAAIDAAMGKT